MKLDFVGAFEASGDAKPVPAVSDACVGEGVNLKVNDCLSVASCYERLKFTPEPKSGQRGIG
jgi:hypothetical protein